MSLTDEKAEREHTSMQAAFRGTLSPQRASQLRIIMARVDLRARRFECRLYYLPLVHISLATNAVMVILVIIRAE